MLSALPTQGFWEGGSPTISDQLLQQPTPLRTEDVGARQAAVPADDAEVGDAVFHQVTGGPQPACAGGEGFAAGAANHRPALEREEGSTQLITQVWGGFGGPTAVPVILTSWMMLETLSQLACLMLSPPSTSPS